MAGGGIKVNNVTVRGGADGATFIPSVSSDGVLSWTNNKGYTNPDPVDIKGPPGEKGDKGEQGIQGIQGIQGEKGDTGTGILEYDSKSAFPATGETGKIYVDKSTNFTYRWDGSTYIQIGGGGSSVNVVQTTGDSETDVMSQKAVTDAINMAVTTALNTEI